MIAPLSRQMKTSIEKLRHGSNRLIPGVARFVALALLLSGQTCLVRADAGRDTFSLRAGLLSWNADGSFASWKDGSVPIYVDLDTVGH